VLAAVHVLPKSLFSISLEHQLGYIQVAMRASCTRPVVSVSASCGVLAPRAPTPRSRSMAALRSCLANTTPAQFSSFHGAKLFLPQLAMSGARQAADPGRKVRTGYLLSGRQPHLISSGSCHT